MELTEQDIINLTNNEKRKAILKAWPLWPVWASVPEIGLTVHKLDLPGGGAFTASWYEGDKVTGRWTVNQYAHLHLIGHDGKLASGSQGWSVLIEELQALRKRLMEARK